MEDLSGFDPHEYCGLVFNLSAERIPSALAQEVARVGHMELWEFQHFVNHDHPFIGEDGERAIEGELRVAEAWADVLAVRFPNQRFIIEIRPLHTMTWYQATDVAPSLDEKEYEPYRAPVKFRIDPRALADAEKSGATEEQIKAIFQNARTPSPRIGASGSCERCGTFDRFTSPHPSPHRGILVMECLVCGKTLAHSTRTVRERVGMWDA